MDATLQQIICQHFTDYAQGRRLPVHHHKAAHALAHCRTSALGTHVQRCPEGHYSRIEANACRNRSCPRCAALAREQWVARQQERLLACDHYHVVFTLPHELLPLFSQHRRFMVDLLFNSVRRTLMTLLRDSRYLGAEPGLLMALHTWGRNLSRHPHIHCLVTGGGLDTTGTWRQARNQYLLPVRVVRALYRGQFLGALREAIDKGHLLLDEQHQQHIRTLIGILWKKTWHVRLKERYSHGQGVIKYLARYVKGGPISNSRIRTTDGTNVRFRYKDHRDGRHKIMTLAATEFLGRILWHLPEPGQHFVRTAGLYSNRALHKRNHAREMLGQGQERSCEPVTWQQYLTILGHRRTASCPLCGSALVAAVPPAQNQNSRYRWCRSAAGFNKTIERSLRTGPDKAQEQPASTATFFGATQCRSSKR